MFINHIKTQNLTLIFEMSEKHLFSSWTANWNSIYIFTAVNINLTSCEQFSYRTSLALSLSIVHTSIWYYRCRSIALQFFQCIRPAFANVHACACVDSQKIKQSRCVFSEILIGYHAPWSWDWNEFCTVTENNCEHTENI